jgi:hypothetical protein
MLVFDTGNMVGVSVSSDFDRLGLRSDGSWTSLSSAGEARGTYRFRKELALPVRGENSV